VRLRRETDPGIVNHHDYLYEVERINKSLSGAVELDLMHFPIDVNGRSVVALYVAGATINGFEYPTGRGTFTCDVNDPDDEDPIPDEGGTPSGLPDDFPDDVDVDPDLPEWPDDVPIPEFPVGPGDVTPGGGGTGGVSNPSDPIDSVPDSEAGGGGSIGGIPTDRPLLPGDEITYTPRCCPAEVLMYAIDADTGIRLQEAPVAIGTAIIGDCEVRFEIFNEYLFDTATAFEFTDRCVDPSSPDGYGPELIGGTTPPVFGNQENVAFNGYTRYRVLSDAVRFYDSTGYIAFRDGNDDGFCGNGDVSSRLWITLTRPDTGETVTFLGVSPGSGCKVGGWVGNEDVYVAGLDPDTGEYVPLFP
jgi:hypothetical protein